MTSALFCKKFGHTFLVWRSDFLSIKDENAAENDESQPDMYGPLWLSITYIILLGLAANINNFFAKQDGFTFDPEYIVEAVGFSIIFLIAEILIYPAAVGCLDGEMSSPEVYIG